MTAEGEVWTWGLSRFGQCGRAADQLVKMRVLNATAPSRHEYGLEFAAPAPLPLPPGLRIIRVRAGFYHTAVITGMQH